MADAQRPVARSGRPSGRIAVWTATLLAIAALLDAIRAVSNGTQSLMCSLAIFVNISLPWCHTPPPPQSYSPAKENNSARKVAASFNSIVGEKMVSPLGEIADVAKGSIARQVHNDFMNGMFYVDSTTRVLKNVCVRLTVYISMVGHVIKAVQLEDAINQLIPEPEGLFPRPVHSPSVAATDGTCSYEDAVYVDVPPIKDFYFETISRWSDYERGLQQQTYLTGTGLKTETKNIAETNGPKVSETVKYEYLSTISYSRCIATCGPSDPTKFSEAVVARRTEEAWFLLDQ